MAIAHVARESERIADAGKIVGVDEEEVVAERVRFDELHLRQNARRCQPNRRTSDRGRALNVPTKKVLNMRALPAFVQPGLHRKALFDDSHVAEAAQERAELAGAVLAQHRRVLVLERGLHQLRQAVQPRDAVVDLEHGELPGREHAAALLDQPLVVGRVLHDAMRVDEIERVVGKRQLLAVGFAQVGLQALLREILARQRRSQTTTGRRR